MFLACFKIQIILFPHTLEFWKINQVLQIFSISPSQVGYRLRKCRASKLHQPITLLCVAIWENVQGGLLYCGYYIKPKNRLGHRIWWLSWMKSCIIKHQTCFTLDYDSFKEQLMSGASCRKISPRLLGSEETWLEKSKKATVKG